MDEEILEKYYRAGEIAANARDKGVEKVKPNASVLEIVDYIESFIIDNGAKPAFPVNIANNHVAAHFTPLSDDKQKFSEGDLVKIDVGAHIDGYIADTAITIEVKTNKYDKLRQSSDDALQKVIDIMRPGVSLTEIGKLVEKTINSYGFRPIDNLTGHSMNRYRLHSGMSIPNVPSMGLRKKPRVDDVIAIEPFATDGAGRVVTGKGSNIYIINNGPHLRSIRDHRSKFHLNKIRRQFNSLPFSHRWCDILFKNADITIKRLSHLGLLHHYPQLIEQDNGMVSQKEHTVIITNDGCEITTLGKS